MNVSDVNFSSGQVLSVYQYRVIRIQQLQDSILYKSLLQNSVDRHVC